MVDLILDRLSPIMIIVALLAYGFLVLFSTRKSELCFALGFPALLFLGQLSEIFPVSISGGAALFSIAAITGALIVRRKVYFDRAQKLLILLALLMLLSVSYSHSPVYGMEKAILFSFLALPITIFAPTILNNRKFLRTTLTVIFATLIIYTCISALFLPRIGGYGIRAAALHDVTVASQYLGLAITLLLINLFMGNIGLGRKIFYGFIIGLASVLLIISGTRSPVLAIALCIIFIAWFAYAELTANLLRVPIKIYTFVVFLILVFFLGLSSAPEQSRGRFTSMEGFWSNFAPHEFVYFESSAGRSLNYIVAVQSIVAKPVLGLGSGGYKYALSKYLPEYSSVHNVRTPAYPHNILLEFGAEQGLPALILITIVFYYNFKLILKLRQIFLCLPSERLPITCCVSCWVFGLILSMTALDIPRMMLLWWGMGLLYAAHHTYGPLVSQSGPLRARRYLKST